VPHGEADDLTVAADLAADGVSDMLSSIATLSPADSIDPQFADLRGNGETLHFHATDDGLDAAGEWLVRRTPSAVTWEHGHRNADVAAHGRALDLLLVLNRRVAPGDTAVEVVGDERLLAHWLEHSVFA
jgi:hypothetical protein